MERLLNRVGEVAWSHPWRLVGLWLILAFSSLWGAIHLPQVLHAGPGSVPSSPSQRVQQLLVDEFHYPYAFSLLVVARGTRTSAEWQALSRKLEAYLKAGRQLPISAVARLDLSSTSGSAPSLLLGLAVHDLEAAERVVPRLRAALAAWVAATAPARGLQLYVTGDAAFSLDMNVLSTEQALEAEKQVLVWSLIVLVIVFRSPVAAALPLLVGVCGICLTMGCLFLLGHRWELSVLVRNVVSMIGLGVGIDYALILVSRFRLESRLQSLPEALATTMRQAGRAIAVSGLTVMAGLTGLLAIPLTITRSIGLGGILAVGIILILALTLLPSLLVLLAPVLDWPAGREPPPFAARELALWQRWSYGVTRRPWMVLLVSSSCLLLLGWPARRMILLPPHLRDMPQAMESRAGAEILLGGQGFASPVYLVLEATRPSHLREKIADIVFWIEDLKTRYRGRITFVVPSLYSPLGLPVSGNDAGWSDDGSKLLILAYPGSELYADDLVKALQGSAVPPSLRLSLGGLAALNAEFAGVLHERFPWVLISVSSAIGLILLVSFRSVLIPLKALLMNALTVAAAFGCLVLVFQDGWGSWWLGLEEAPGCVLLTVPILLFCIAFGLSMDYEVFLLSRIREAHLQSAENRDAVAQGLAHTGGQISGAALIMITVFAAFARADIVLVKETGFGLGVAVFLDATLVRVLLVPAVMQLAGRWNWWLPGGRN